MNIHVKGLEPGQTTNKGRGDSLGQGAGHAGMDSKKPDMVDLRQALQDGAQCVIPQHQGIASGEDHFVDGAVGADIIDARCKDCRINPAPTEHVAFSHAKATVQGALVGDHESHAPGIAMDQSGHRGLDPFGQWIGRAFDIVQLGRVGDHLPGNGVVRCLDQGKKIGVHPHGRAAGFLPRRLKLIG